jgi:hypothetical protein
MLKASNPGSVSVTIIEVSWFKSPPVNNLEPTIEIQRIVARAIVEFMLSLQDCSDPCGIDSIYDLAERIDSRLANSRFPKDSELSVIWDMSDYYPDFPCEPQAYVGDDTTPTYGEKLIGWATEVLRGRYEESGLS